MALAGAGGFLFYGIGVPLSLFCMLYHARSVIRKIAAEQKAATRERWHKMQLELRVVSVEKQLAADHRSNATAREARSSAQRANEREQYSSALSSYSAEESCEIDRDRGGAWKESLGEYEEQQEGLAQAAAVVMGNQRSNDAEAAAHERESFCARLRRLRRHFIALTMAVLYTQFDSKYYYYGALAIDVSLSFPPAHRLLACRCDADGPQARHCGLGHVPHQPHCVADRLSRGHLRALLCAPGEAHALRRPQTRRARGMTRLPASCVASRVRCARLQVGLHVSSLLLLGAAAAFAVRAPEERSSKMNNCKAFDALRCLFVAYRRIGSFLL